MQFYVGEVVNSAATIRSSPSERFSSMLSSYKGRARRGRPRSGGDRLKVKGHPLEPFFAGGASASSSLVGQLANLPEIVVAQRDASQHAQRVDLSDLIVTRSSRHECLLAQLAGLLILARAECMQRLLVSVHRRTLSVTDCRRSAAASVTRTH